MVAYSERQHPNRSTLLKSLVFAAFSALMLCLVTGCASNGGASNSVGTPVGGTGIQMFGTIDAGVSRTDTKR